MKFDSNTLDHLKKLCRIECSEEEDLDILQSLQRVLSYMDLLGEVDTKGVEPCNYVLSSMQKNLMRDDKVQEILPRERFLANAPDQIGGMVRTPSILKDL